MGFLNLKAMLSLNASGFNIGMKRAESQAKAFSKEIKGEFVRAFGTAALIGFSKKVIDAADSITDLSDELNVSTKTLQEWQYAAKKNGASAEDVTKFFEAIAESRKRAIDGNEEAIESYQRFGISVLKLSRMRTPEIGKAIGDVFKNGGDPQILGPFLKELGGKSARKLIPAFKEGLDELAVAAKDAGAVWNEEVLGQLKRSKDEVELLTDTIRGPFAQAIAYAASLMRSAFETGQDWIGGLASYLGAFTSGINPAQDMTKFNWRDAHKSGVEAMNGSQAERDKEREARAQQYKAPIGPAMANDFDPGYGKRPADRLLNLSLMKLIGESSKPEGLDSWQKAGAAVRQEVSMPIWKSMDNHLERLVEKIDALKNVNNSQNFMENSGFGGF
jgi:hypothetical protein